MKTLRAGPTQGPSWRGLVLKPLLIFGLLGLSMACRGVDLLAPWQLYFENTASASYRENPGDTRFSIFPVVGVEAFNHTYLAFDRQLNADIFMTLIQ